MLAWTRPEPVVALLLWEGPRTLRNVYRGETLLQCMLVGRTLRKRADSCTCNEVKLCAWADFSCAEKRGAVTRQGGGKGQMVLQFDETSGSCEGSARDNIRAQRYDCKHILYAPTVSTSVSSPFPSLCLSRPIAFDFLSVSSFSLLVSLFPPQSLLPACCFMEECSAEESIWSRCCFDLKMEGGKEAGREGGKEGFLRLHVSPITPLRWHRNSLLHSATGGRERDA